MDTALHLARQEPGSPITMEKVARALGTRPMSLYTHVRNREELMALAAERALGEWTASVPTDAAWDEQLRAWCTSLRDHLAVYSTLMFEMTSQGTFQPALVRAVAVLARILRAAGLEGDDLAAAVRWVPQTVLGVVVLEAGRPADLRTPDQEAAAVLGALAGLDDADRAEFDDVVPRLLGPSLPDLFEYSIDRLIDGVRAVSSRR